MMNGKIPLAPRHQHDYNSATEDVDNGIYEVPSSVNIRDIKNYLQRDLSDNLCIHLPDNRQSKILCSLLQHAKRAMEMCSASHIGFGSVPVPEDRKPGSVSFALALMIWNILDDANSSLLSCEFSPLLHSTFSPETGASLQQMKIDMSKGENASSGSDESADEELKMHVKGHKFKITKSIPRDIIYCRRGVRCEFCPYAVKGPRCLDQLIQHTKQSHRAKATPRNLSLVRQANTVERLVGEGMPYCFCELCTFPVSGT